MNSIVHKKHDLYSETVEKVALSSNDNKRIVMGNKIDTMAYGHYMGEMIDIYENIFGFKS